MAWLQRLMRIVTFYQLYRCPSRAETVAIGSLPVSDEEVYLRYNGCYYCRVSDTEHERVDTDGFAVYEPELFNPGEFVIRGRLQILDRIA